MRNLRAELRDWSEGAPMEWRPAPGDILVGFLRAAASTDSHGTPGGSVIIDEERTRAAVLVSLQSPELAGLFGLHNPRAGDKIGIRCVGSDQDGTAHFTMVIDREARIETAPPGDAEPPAVQDCASATPEERSFIERMLAQSEPKPEAHTPTPAGPSHLAGLIQRREDELAQQPQTLARMERLFRQPEPDPPAAAQPEAVSEPTAKRPGRTLRLVLILVLLAAGACTVLALLGLTPGAVGAH